MCPAKTFTFPDTLVVRDSHVTILAGKIRLLEIIEKDLALTI